MLGVSSRRYRDFPDNRMDIVPLLIVVQIVEDAFETLEPSLIHTHHCGDLNLDHQIIQRAVMTACRPQPKHPVRDIYAFGML